MRKRILFIGSLHHPEQLRQDHIANPSARFPTSMRQHFLERALLRRGYELDVFWRNLSGFGSRDIAGLHSQRFSQQITPGKIAAAAMRRLPPNLNPDYVRRNQFLIEQARDFQPEIIWMIGDNTIITADTLAQLKREHNALLIYATGTSPIVFSHPIERNAARLYDLVLVNDYYHGIQWLELGARQMVCLPVVAIDPDFHDPRHYSVDEQSQDPCALRFVGTLLPYNLYSERIAALEAVRDFNPGIWSVHELPPTLQPYNRGYALGAEMMRVLASARVTINVHGDFMRYGGNMRLFEAAAMGAFQIVDDRPGVHEWFTEGEHLVVFRDHDDLRQKVRYYLDHPQERERIVAAARHHVLEHHTYEQRLNKLEALLHA